MMIRFIADENFPVDSVRLLRMQQYDVVAVTEETPAVEDDQILRRAAAEERIILTFDHDFGRLIFRSGKPAPSGVVLFRTGPAYPAEPADLLLSALARSEITLLGRFTVVERDRVRQRPTP